MIYEIVKNYITQKNYIKALKELEKIQEYKDSSEISTELKYLMGVQKYDEGNISTSL